ncbi:DExH-box splicing factor binding site-domain-containing protein [Sporodiniella umbellata]|nr:DExH-box splicing factor binding site-domain-containing protein [Sporodiniella umbellata]
MSARLPLQSKVARPRFEKKATVFGNDDDLDENTADELVVGLEDKQVKEAKPKERAVAKSIAPLANADWRATAKRKRDLYVPTRTQPTVTETKTEILEQTTTSFGLQIQAKKAEAMPVFTETVVQKEEVVVEQEIKKTLEESAIEALIRESRGETDESEQGPVRVIPANETLSFRDDVEARPDETTVEDYEDMPVDEFGPALLRGMGWSEGEGIGKNRKNAPLPAPAPAKQREALLGLGAKPEDLEKDAKAKYKHRREAYQYKDTSLFKKISKRSHDDEYHDKKSNRHRNSDDYYEKKKYDDYGDRKKYDDYDEKRSKYHDKRKYDDRRSDRYDDERSERKSSKYKKHYDYYDEKKQDSSDGSRRR